MFLGTSIRSRLNQLALVPVGLALVLSLLGSLAWSRFQLRESALLTLNANAKVLSLGLEGPVAFDYAQEAQQHLDRLADHPEVRTAHIFVDGKIFAQYPKDGPSATLMAIGTNYLESNEAVVYVPVGDGVLRVSEDLDAVSKALWSTSVALLVCLLVCGVFGYVLAARLRRAIELPITELARVAQSVSADGNYDVEVQTGGTGEIRTLVEAFSRMLGAIRRRDHELSGKNQELEDIIYVTSHDLRSPLVNVHGFGEELRSSAAELTDLLASADLDAEIKAPVALILEEDIPMALDFITQSARRMDDLLRGLLHLSRLGRTPMRFETVDMNQLVDSVLATVQFQIRSLGVTVHRRELPTCEGDVSLLTQLFSNLIDNALKYRDPVRPLILEIGGRRDGDSSTYFVSDTGIGIDTQYSQKVFQMFHRLKDKASASGEGLGLAVVRRAAERHGGVVRVDGVVGEGSTFHVSIPSRPVGDEGEPV